MSYLIFDSGYRGPCNKEDDDGISFYAWVIYHFPEVNIFHVANESGVSTSAGHIEKRRRKGVTQGVSDYIILTPGIKSFAVIELKRKDKTKSKVSKDQIEFLDRVVSDGGYAAVAYGLEEAKKAFLQYYNKPVAL